MKVYLSLLLFIFEVPAFAAIQFPAQARLFAGATTADPTNVNQEMDAQGLKEFKSIAKYGLEITYPALSLLEVGLRYTKRYIKNGEVNPTPNADYRALLDQDSVSLIARVPFIKTQVVRVDVFGGVGGSNTSLKIKTATQDGELSRRASNDWYATLQSSLGGTVAVGFKNFYVFLEGGFESNKVGSLQRSGTINGNIQTIDLSGGYASIGLMFDGITATSK